ncbi:hypothetical protein HJG60_008539 [Phyllostomus discolor]|uniref:Uncharacterized protein n=1 Tax=Phyllostomus discolor TaxID=89673 RepID=A0A833Z3M2_9CHIR|nr:hypothetical protein HJG60_008539 [Phyllostomus discolor]
MTLVTYTHIVSSARFMYAQIRKLCTYDCPAQSRTSFMYTSRCVWRPARETVTAVRVRHEHVQHLHVCLPPCLLTIRCWKHFMYERPAQHAPFLPRAGSARGADVAPANPPLHFPFPWTQVPINVWAVSVSFPLGGLWVSVEKQLFSCIFLGI